jgi:hypothetical protein
MQRGSAARGSHSCPSVRNRRGIVLHIRRAGGCPAPAARATIGAWTYPDLFSAATSRASARTHGALPGRRNPGSSCASGRASTSGPRSGKRCRRGTGIGSSSGRRLRHCGAGPSSAASPPPCCGTCRCWATAIWCMPARPTAAAGARAPGSAGIWSIWARCRSRNVTGSWSRTVSGQHWTWPPSNRLSRESQCSTMSWGRALAPWHRSAAEYRNAEYLRGRTPAEALTDEKRREDRIRATGRRVIRWTWSELANPGSFSAFLADAGVPRQPLPACRR